MVSVVDDIVVVSADMTIILGQLPCPERALLPPDPIFMHMVFGKRPALWFGVACDAGAAADLTLAVSQVACESLFGWVEFENIAYHVPTKLRLIALAVMEGLAAANACSVYRRGKGIELLCEIFQFLDKGELVPIRHAGNLSLADSERVLAARQLIDECWHEKLTLDRIARACGLNRAKLTRGFREMFNSSVTDAIAERRLAEARTSLLTTNLPVASIGYQSGYLNNAAFARAFSRRFGVSPTHFRATGLAA